MFLSLMFLCILSLSSMSFSRHVDSKSVFRSGGEFGAVSLVEFNIRGVVYGKCSYNNKDGKEITVYFEQDGEEVQAKGETAMILNPIDETRYCREVASKSPEGSTFRSDELDVDGTDADLVTRFNDIQSKIEKSQDYLDMLKPRFIKLVSTGVVYNTTFPNFNIFNKPAINISTFNIPVPVINIPVAIKNIPIPVIVPTIQTFNFQKPVLGK